MSAPPTATSRPLIAPNAPRSDDVVEFSGWLQKRSVSSQYMHNWKRRFVVLRQNRIEWCASAACGAAVLVRGARERCPADTPAAARLAAGTPVRP
eukprot:5495782-Prymnesium_polylepis.1